MHHWIRFRLYRLKYWLAQWIDWKAPVHIDIEVTSACNLRCPICHQSDSPRVYELKKLNEATVKQRLLEARQMGVLSFKPNWRGEALIHADIWEILGYALGLDFVDILINTNLSVHLSDDEIKILARIPTVKVSIDSITNYKVARRGGDLDVVLTNMVRLGRMGKVLSTNRHESHVTEPWHEYRQEFWNQYLTKWCQLFGASAYEVIKASSAFSKIKMHNNVAKKRNKTAGMFVGAKAGAERKYCGMPSRRMLISGTTQNIYPCCVPYAEPADMAIGDRHTSLRDAWNGVKMAAMRDNLKNGINPTETCLNCVSSDAWR
jgi:MoaA/NifB/PqqE/SkfB family radical SAM enzyme